ncbi:hypothetical protein HRH59_14240 [Rheinheimera sp. YQF-2]|uniref:Uncharacterized protein n=1 Tax=Rheinheimera lutimaris TaxID=2740584 RepID=A0A7Y5EIP9_9GAMM|nr:hypothetical protein [Rheinheimera lutimaris]NRQ43709.1 hypothetical protein [Rheinheimera lutimaris]
MQELTFEQVEEVSGGSRIRGLLDAASYTAMFMEAKQLVQSGGGYFYDNVMLSNNWIDDLNWTQK